jgi:6-phosphogluconolactonase/glucosamine-6-phosphate isomerase/deaminase
VLATAVEGPEDPACPASFLQRHPDATVIADEPAATRLARRPR